MQDYVIVGDNDRQCFKQKGEAGAQAVARDRADDTGVVAGIYKLVREVAPDKPPLSPGKMDAGFLVRRQDGTAWYALKLNLIDAEAEAQLFADLHTKEVGVWRLEKTFKPQPEAKTIPHDIDKLIDMLEKRQEGSTGAVRRAVAIHCGVLRQLKKDGVTHLDLPGEI